jgi:hypothetical protein
MKPAKPRFCINCRYCSEIGAAMQWRCTKSKVGDGHGAAKRDPVTGDYSYPTCGDCRTDKHWCGPQGQWFKRRPKLTKRAAMKGGT